MVNKMISINERDLRLIETYCKETGRTFSGFLVRTAVREIKEEGPVIKRSSIWDLLTLRKE